MGWVVRELKDYFAVVEKIVNFFLKLVKITMSKIIESLFDSTLGFIEKKGLQNLFKKSSLMCRKYNFTLNTVENNKVSNH